MACEIEQVALVTDLANGYQLEVRREWNTEEGTVEYELNVLAPKQTETHVPGAVLDSTVTMPFNTDGTGPRPSTLTHRGDAARDAAHLRYEEEDGQSG